MKRLRQWTVGMLIGGLAFAGAAGADEYASTQPAYTAVPAVGPTTAPAVAAVDVLVVPFKPLGDAGPDWIAKGVCENLVTDLSTAKFHPAPAGKSFDDNAAALTAAKEVSARYVVTGSFQSADGQLRFTGQILAVSSGQSIGGISSTGSVRDLFAIEDSLSQQTIRTLIAVNGAPQNPGQNPAAAPAKPVPAGLQPNAVAQVIQPPAAIPGSHYQGSALQAYVDANRTPSQDFDQQLQNSRDNSQFGSYNTGPANVGIGFVGYGYGYGYPLGYGGFGFGSTIYGGAGPGTGYTGHGSTSTGGTGGGHHGDGGHH